MSKVTRGVLNVGLALVLAFLLAVVGPSLDAQPTELEAVQATEDRMEYRSLEARAEEWVDVAKRANPKLTEKDLSNIRAAAIYREGMKQ